MGIKGEAITLGNVGLNLTDEQDAAFKAASDKKKDEAAKISAAERKAQVTENEIDAKAKKASDEAEKAANEARQTAAKKAVAAEPEKYPAGAQASSGASSKPYSPAK